MRRVRIGVSGAAGRMGRRVVALAASRKDLVLACALVRRGSPDVGRDAGELVGAGRSLVRVRDRLDRGECDVLIDFSAPAGLSQRLSECLAFRTPLVVGTTGLAPALRKRLAAASHRIPILAAPNMSLGANLLRSLVETASRVLVSLRPDVEILETHHAGKKDAPSGTALWLADGVDAGAGRTHPRVHGRRGVSGPRPHGQIGIHAVRAGRVVGEHTVLFAAGSERLELVHRADSRGVFAEGALAAALFLARPGRRPGLYGMGDVLCLTANSATSGL